MKLQRVFDLLTNPQPTYEAEQQQARLIAADIISRVTFKGFLCTECNKPLFVCCATPSASEWNAIQKYLMLNLRLVDIPTEIAEDIHYRCDCDD